MKIKNFFSFLTRPLFKNKWRIVSSIFAFFFFLFLFFPYSELTGLITSKVAQATKNQLLLQMKDFKPFFFPSVGVKLKDVHIIGKGMAVPLNISQIKASLSLIDLLLLKMSYSLEVKDLFEGNTKISIKRGKKIEDKKKKKNHSTKGFFFVYSKFKP